jgi:hypothetical protein
MLCRSRSCLSLSQAYVMAESGKAARSVASGEFAVTGQSLAYSGGRPIAQVCSPAASSRLITHTATTRSGALGLWIHWSRRLISGRCCFGAAVGARQAPSQRRAVVISLFRHLWPRQQLRGDHPPDGPQPRHSRHIVACGSAR